MPTGTQVFGYQWEIGIRFVVLCHFAAYNDGNYDAVDSDSLAENDADQVFRPDARRFHSPSNNAASSSKYAPKVGTTNFKSYSFLFGFFLDANQAAPTTDREIHRPMPIPVHIYGEVSARNLNRLER